MLRSPLCSRLFNFYTRVCPVRQQLASSSQSIWVKIDFNVVTLRPCRQFLYPRPPCASKGWFDFVPVREIHAFLVLKVDVDVATLRPGSPGGPCWRLRWEVFLLPLEITVSRPAELCVHMRSKSMSILPLYGKTVDFYKPPGKTRYTMSPIRATAQNTCIFYIQSVC